MRLHGSHIGRKGRARFIRMNVDDDDDDDTSEEQARGRRTEVGERCRRALRVWQAKVVRGT